MSVNLFMGPAGVGKTDIVRLLAQARRHRQRFAQGWRRRVRRFARTEVTVLEEALHAHFEPEFLNRIDPILMFEPIGSQWLDAVLDVELSKLNQGWRPSNARYTWTNRRGPGCAASTMCVSARGRWPGACGWNWSRHLAATVCNACLVVEPESTGRWDPLTV